MLSVSSRGPHPNDKLTDAIAMSRLQTHDVVLKVDGQAVTQDNISLHVRGTNTLGSKVTLTVKRHATGLVEDVVCVRAPSIFVEHTKDMYL